MNTASITRCAGFEPGPVSSAEGRLTPRFYRFDAPEGRVRVRLSIASTQPVEEALLFTNHRRLVYRGALRAGGTLHLEFLVSVTPFLPANTDYPIPCDAVELALIAPGASIECVKIEPCSAPAVFLMGDSTVTDQGAVYPYAPGATYAGWGQMLQAFVQSNACVFNYARSGLTLETFRTEGLLDLACRQIQPGDLVLIQFGHNDQKRPHLKADDGFAKALFSYLELLRMLKAVPVLVTPLARNSWTHDGWYFDLLSDYAKIVSRMGAATNTPVIDLHNAMEEFLRKNRRDPSKVYFHPGDYTHTNDFGAYFAARFIAGQLDRLGLLSTQDCGNWTPAPPFDVLVSERNDELLPPQGLEAIYRSFETERPDAPLTNVEALELACRSAALFAHNGPCTLPDDVPQGEPMTEIVCCAVQNGVILEEMAHTLHPYRRICRQDLLRLLVRAWGMRCTLTPYDGYVEGVIARAHEEILLAVGMGLAGPQDAFMSEITRKEAAKICRSIVI